MPDRDFAARLAEAMNKAGLNQAQLAKAMGVSPPTVSRWLEGSVPHRLAGLRLCSFLNVTHEWLLFGMRPEPDLNFTAEMAARIKSARQEEGVALSEISKLTKISESDLELIESGKLNPSWRGIALLKEVLNLNEEWLLEGKGVRFRKESRFALIGPGDIVPSKQRAAALREQAHFLMKQADRLEWEIKESEKFHAATKEHYPRLVRAPRKRKLK